MIGLYIVAGKLQALAARNSVPDRVEAARRLRVSSAGVCVAAGIRQ